VRAGPAGEPAAGPSTSLRTARAGAHRRVDAHRRAGAQPPGETPCRRRRTV